jgi:transposase-like protein
VGAYKRDHAGEEPALTVNEPARLRELERETRELQMEPAFLKSSGILRQGSSLSDKFEFIDAEYANGLAGKNKEAPSIVRMCRRLEVKRSSFNDWRSRSASRSRRPTARS